MPFSAMERWRFTFASELDAELEAALRFPHERRLVDPEQAVERVLLEGADGAAEEARADEEDEVGHDDEEGRECCSGLLACEDGVHAETYCCDWQRSR